MNAAPPLTFSPQLQIAHVFSEKLIRVEIGGLMSHSSSSPHVPLSEWVKAIPGVFGVRLEDEPAFEVIGHDGDVELRRYGTMVLAQVELPGPREQAVDRAFNLLASYLFGENESHKKMEMTTRVFQESSEVEETWVISFVLPTNVSLATAPRPKDPSIRLVAQPPRTMATVRFSGRTTAAHRHEAAEKLWSWITLTGAKDLSPLIWAEYDQPFSVPALRRNEVQIEITDPRLS